MTLRGNVHMKEGDRSADAQKAVFARVAQTTVLTGQAVARDESSETRPPRLLFTRTPEGSRRKVKCGPPTLEQSKTAIQLSSSPSNVIADHMVGNSKTGRALYTGHARLWQGPSVLEADSIELLRERES